MSFFSQTTKHRRNVELLHTLTYLTSLCVLSRWRSVGREHSTMRSEEEEGGRDGGVLSSALRRYYNKPFFKQERNHHYGLRSVEFLYFPLWRFLSETQSCLVDYEPDSPSLFALLLFFKPGPMLSSLKLRLPLSSLVRWSSESESYSKHLTHHTLVSLHTRSIHHAPPPLLSNPPPRRFLLPRCSRSFSSKTTLFLLSQAESRRSLGLLDHHPSWKRSGRVEVGWVRG